MTSSNPTLCSRGSAPPNGPPAAHYITGTAHPDPGWDGKLSLAKQHDQGVVVLDAAATTKWPAITPAPLPPVGYLDRNQGQLKNEPCSPVGMCSAMPPM
jgi:hypothetical protein